MAIQNPPITENEALDFTLLELIRLINNLEQKNLKLINDISTATNFADLQTKVDE